MSTTPAVDAAVLRTFTDGFAGRVLQSSDDGYKSARRVHNGLIDRRPGVMAQCRRPRTSPPRCGSRPRNGSRSRFAAAATTWPDAACPRAA